MVNAEKKTCMFVWLKIWCAGVDCFIFCFVLKKRTNGSKKRERFCFLSIRCKLLVVPALWAKNEKKEALTLFCNILRGLSFIFSRHFSSILVNLCSKSGAFLESFIPEVIDPTCSQKSMEPKKQKVVYALA